MKHNDRKFRKFLETRKPLNRAHALEFYTVSMYRDLLNTENAVPSKNMNFMRKMRYQQQSSIYFSTAGTAIGTALPHFP